MADVVDLITQDHRNVERMFDEIARDPSRKAELVPEICQVLVEHSYAERAELYPFAVQEMAEGAQVQESEEEHDEIEELIRQLRSYDPASDEAASMLDHLETVVRMHSQEEEETILARMTQELDAERLDQLGDRFIEAKQTRAGTEEPDS